MPNHISTTLTIFGDPHDLAACRRRHVRPCAGGTGLIFDFATIIAPPDGLEPGDPAWEVAAWGTKWVGTHCQTLLGAPGLFMCRFVTAWQPPVPIFHRLGAMYPDFAWHVIARDDDQDQHVLTMAKAPRLAWHHYPSENLTS